MGFFRQISKRTLLLWSLFVSLCFLCSQGTTLHVHNFDSDTHISHSHMADKANNHAHLSNIHYAKNKTHDEHHDNIAPDIDVSPDGILKSLSNNILTVALLALLFISVLSNSSHQVFHRCRESKLILQVAIFFLRLYGHHHTINPPATLCRFS